MENRYCFVCDKFGHWYIIKSDKRGIFRALNNTDATLLADEFDGDRIYEPVEKYSFEFPYIEIEEDEEG